MRDQFEKRMNAGIKIVLVIDKIQKEGGNTSMDVIVSKMREHEIDEDMVRDLLFGLTRQGTLMTRYNKKLEVEVYEIVR